MGIVASRAGHFWRPLKAGRLDQSDRLKANNFFVVRDDILFRLLFGAAMALRTAMNGFQLREILERAGHNFAVAGDVCLLRAMAALAGDARMNARLFNPAIAQWQLRGMTTETVSGFGVVEQHAQVLEVSWSGILLLSWSDAESVERGVPGPTELDKVGRSPTVRDGSDPGSRMTPGTKAPVQWQFRRRGGRALNDGFTG